MRKTIDKALLVSAIAFIVAASVPSAHAGTYLDALRQCGSEWKQSDQRKQTKKGEGMQAWQAYRKECVDRVGYTSKRKGNA